MLRPPEAHERDGARCVRCGSVALRSAPELADAAYNATCDVGLTVSPLLDERRDPVRSTPKALDVLAEHYERFGSWYLALAAYNAGPARVSRNGRLVSRVF